MKTNPDPTGTDRLVGGCPLKLRGEKGRWVAEIQDPVACSPTIEKMDELGPEVRRNLARHLETDDPQQSVDLKQMRKKTP